MAYVILGHAEPRDCEDIYTRLVQLNEENSLLYVNLEATEDRPGWLKVGQALQQAVSIVKCGSDELHSALDALALLDRRVQPTLLWYYLNSHGEDTELLGAVLRASLCFSCRTILISPNADFARVVENLWISVYISPVLLSGIQGLTLPQWRGQLILGEGQHVYVEITDNGLDSIQTKKPSVLSGAVMELVSEVNLSTVHSCMLGHTYSLQLGTPGVLQLSKCSGYVVRMVTPQKVSAAASLNNTTSAWLSQAAQVKEITSAEQWVSYVLRETLHTPEPRPLGPVRYKYFLLHPQTSHPAFLCSEFETDELTTLLLLSDSRSCAEPCMTSLYHELQDHSSSPQSLSQELELTADMLESLLERNHNSWAWMARDEKDTDIWNERRALQCYTQTQPGLQQSDESQADSKENTGSVLTLSSVKKHFSKDGIALDAKYRLRSGNFEKEGLRDHEWPHSTLHYGPGICYHTDDGSDSNVDPRLLMYRDKRGFSETSSLYNSDLLYSKKGATAGSSLKRPLPRAFGQSSGVSSPKALKRRKSPSKKPLSALPSSEADDKPTTSKQVLPKKLSAPQRSGKEVSSKQSATCSREERASRNKRNEMKMERAVSKALAKKGIQPSDKHYEEYKKELFALSLRSVKELKTSFDLEKKMRDIADAFAPAAVMTVNMKNK